MILYSESKINFIEPVIALERIKNNSTVYYYVDLQTYNKAFLLKAQYGKPGNLAKALGIADKYSITVDFCVNLLPDPLNMLGAYLCMVDLGVADRDERVCAGILHQMSKVIDFYELTKVPAEVRAKVTLSSEELRAYEASWSMLVEPLKTSDIKMDNLDVEVLRTIIRSIFEEMQIPTGGYTRMEVSQVSESTSYNEDKEDEENEWVDPFAGLMNEDILEEFDSVEINIEEKKDEDDKEENISAEEVEPEEGPKEKTPEEILDAIMAKMNA